MGFELGTSDWRHHQLSLQLKSMIFSSINVVNDGFILDGSKIATGCLRLRNYAIVLSRLQNPRYSPHPCPRVVRLISDRIMCDSGAFTT